MVWPTKSFLSVRKTNWCKCSRQGIVNHLHQQFEQYYNVKLSADEIVTAFEAAFTNYLPVVVSARSVRFRDDTRLKVGGCYHSDNDRRQKACIELCLEIRKVRSLVLDETTWRRIFQVTADTVLHEVIHMRQYRRRQFEYLPCFSDNTRSLKYYASKDEIEAYAFNIACELVESVGSDTTQIYNLLQQPDAVDSSDTLIEYYKRFGPEHPVRKKLAAQIIKNVKPAVAGKPFLKSKFLTY